MPLTADEYRCLESFSVLYSGGLDSAAVAVLMGKMVIQAPLRHIFQRMVPKAQCRFASSSWRPSVPSSH